MRALFRQGKVVSDMDLPLEKWSTAFKAFNQQKTPLDLVIEGILTPSEAEYAYKKYMDLLKYSRREIPRKEIPSMMVLLFGLGAFAIGLDVILTREILARGGMELNPLADFLIRIFGTANALNANLILSSAILLALTFLSVKYLHGAWMYIPLALHTAIRFMAALFNLYQLLF